MFGQASSARKKFRALVPDADPTTAASPRGPAPDAPALRLRRLAPPPFISVPAGLEMLERAAQEALAGRPAFAVAFIPDGLPLVGTWRRRRSCRQVDLHTESPLDIFEENDQELLSSGGAQLAPV